MRGEDGPGKREGTVGSRRRLDRVEKVVVDVVVLDLRQVGDGVAREDGAKAIRAVSGRVSGDVGKSKVKGLPVPCRTPAV